MGYGEQLHVRSGQEIGWMMENKTWSVSTTKPKVIIIIIKGGCVVEVKNVPHDYDIEIIDRDIQE